jgi:hypothetical protein
MKKMHFDFIKEEFERKVTFRNDGPFSREKAIMPVVKAFCFVEFPDRLELINLFKENPHPLAVTKIDNFMSSYFLRTFFFHSQIFRTMHPTLLNPLPFRHREPPRSNSLEFRGARAL